MWEYTCAGIRSGASTAHQCATTVPDRCTPPRGLSRQETPALRQGINHRDCSVMPLCGVNQSFAAPREAPISEAGQGIVPHAVLAVPSIPLCDGSRINTRSAHVQSRATDCIRTSRGSELSCIRLWALEVERTVGSSSTVSAAPCGSTTVLRGRRSGRDTQCTQWLLTNPYRCCTCIT